MPRSTLSVVPWYNPHQFRKVHEAIFSSDVTAKRWALDQISVWETRCFPALPAGIEATVVICKAIIQDILHDNITSICQDDDIRYIYSIALIRFVCLTLEMHQEDGVPLVTIAGKEGLPAWILELRNQAAHSYCPSLPTLRAAADHGMKYLKRAYWDVEKSQIQSYIKEVKNEELEIFDLITTFKEYKYKEIKEEIECSKEIKKVVAEMFVYVKHNRMRFVELLAFPGMFVFSEEELNLILKGIDDTFIKNSQEIELPDVLEYFWDKILLLLVKFDLISDFAETLLLTQEMREPLSQKLVISWVLRIIKSVAFEEANSSIFVTYFKSHGVFIDWKRLLFACSKYPVSNTPTLFPIIAAHLNIEQPQVASLMYLVAIFQGKALDKKEKSDNAEKSEKKKALERVDKIKALEEELKSGLCKIFTVQDAKQRKAMEDNQRKGNVTAENLWSYSKSDIDFASLPIGAILNPVYDVSSSFEENDEDNHEKYIIKSADENAADVMTDINGDNEEEIMTDEDDDDFDDLTDTAIEEDMIYRRRDKSKQ